jgi:hypothetical protein
MPRALFSFAGTVSIILLGAWPGGGPAASLAIAGGKPPTAAPVSSPRDRPVRDGRPASSEPTTHLPGHEGGTTALTFSPDGAILGSAGLDGTVRLWQVASHRLLHTLHHPDLSVLTIAWSPDGKHLVSSGGNGLLCLWNPATGKELRQLQGHQGAVAALAFSPDGATLASGGDDRTIRLWDPARGRERRSWRARAGEQEWITGLAFAPDGKQLASAGIRGQALRGALTWNVFRTLQECGLLHVLAKWITGLDIQREPHLYLWGLEISDGTFAPWDLLIAARKRFESNLPVKRPPTEPDIALYLLGYYLILIEAKFTSPNPFYMEGPRRDPQSLTKNELLDIYQDPALQMLHLEKARRAERVYYQLWRSVVFAEWMARHANAGTVAYVANLTRDDQEHASFGEFQGLMNPESTARFVHLNWEDTYRRMIQSPELSTLWRYMETKTAGLQQAFSLKGRGGNLPLE